MGIMSTIGDTGVIIIFFGPLVAGILLLIYGFTMKDVPIPLSVNTPFIPKVDYCISCGKPLQKDWSACPYCGADAPKRCSICGKKIEPNWICCPNCGGSIL
jgi:predicted RNA-binding Zn-ribbon protein involved in translation (DUF1610 family)